VQLLFLAGLRSLWDVIGDQAIAHPNQPSATLTQNFDKKPMFASELTSIHQEHIHSAKYGLVRQPLLGCIS
jgi:hypothetical protein